MYATSDDPSKLARVWEAFARCAAGLTLEGIYVTVYSRDDVDRDARKNDE